MLCTNRMQHCIERDSKAEEKRSEIKREREREREETVEETEMKMREHLHGVCCSVSQVSFWLECVFDVLLSE